MPCLFCFSIAQDLSVLRKQWNQNIISPRLENWLGNFCMSTIFLTAKYIIFFIMHVLLLINNMNLIALIIDNKWFAHCNNTYSCLDYTQTFLVMLLFSFLKFIFSKTRKNFFLLNQETDFSFLKEKIYSIYYIYLHAKKNLQKQNRLSTAYWIKKVKKINIYV